MAIIRPEHIDVRSIEQHSKAEALIFEKVLGLDPTKTKDWVFYYSYYFKGHQNNRSPENYSIKAHNEIDFLVLAPGVGFFVFEIKGGDIQVEEDGNLVSINRVTRKPYKIEPYKQAKENYYALNELLKELSHGSNGLSFDSFVGGTLVGFPDISSLPNVGLQSNGDDTYVNGMNLYSFIMRNSQFLKSRDPNKAVPTKNDVEKFENLLNGPEFTYSLNARDYIFSINLTITQLTDEQQTVFRGLLQNKRCLISGLAGTGKTVLCSFLYKQLTDEKKLKVLYLSFNRLIAQRVEQDLVNGGNSKCFPIFDYLEMLYMKANHKVSPYLSLDEKKQYLFKEIGTLLSTDHTLEKFDCLIIDEAQDIEYNEDVLFFLDSLLNGGLKDGSCYIFYDDQQIIFDKKAPKLYDAEDLGDKGYRYARFNLEKNCRNAPDIAETLHQLLKNKTLDQSLLNTNTRYFDVSENEAGAKKIKKEIDELTAQGVKNSQITLLFNLRPENEKNLIFKSLKKIYGKHFSEYKVVSEQSPGLTYSTVNGFKGLENDIIFYINDNKFASNSVHYVASSRAKVYLYILKTHD